jgi:hypothetical protein
LNTVPKWQFAVLLAALLSMQACSAPVAYSAKPIQGRVVDAETKQPLSDVNVVAHWVLNFGLEGGSGTDLVLMESVTDSEGQYKFPGWGPTQVPASLPSEARLKSLSPEMIYFKPGYLPWAVTNTTTGPQPGPGPLMRTSEWDGRTIELKRFEGPLTQYGSVIGGTLTGVSYGHCNWKKIPRVIVALDAEKRRLEALNIRSWATNITDLEFSEANDGCGSVRDFFKAYQK